MVPIPSQPPATCHLGRPPWETPPPCRGAIRLSSSLGWCPGARIQPDLRREVSSLPLWAVLVLPSPYQTLTLGLSYANQTSAFIGAPALPAPPR